MARDTIAALLLIGSSLAWTQPAVGLDNSVTGTFKCECIDAQANPTSGTCTVTNYPNGTGCSKEATDTCTGKCSYSSSTSGAEAAARVKNSAKRIAPVQSR